MTINKYFNKHKLPLLPAAGTTIRYYLISRYSLGEIPHRIRRPLLEHGIPTPGFGMNRSLRTAAHPTVCKGMQGSGITQTGPVASLQAVTALFANFRKADNRCNSTTQINTPEISTWKYILCSKNVGFRKSLFRTLLPLYGMLPRQNTYHGRPL